MNKCPKCGCTRIHGPRYRRREYGAEALEYECSQCRYKEDHPCLDADMPPGRPGAGRPVVPVARKLTDMKWNLCAQPKNGCVAGGSYRAQA